MSGVKPTLGSPRDPVPKPAARSILTPRPILPFMGPRLSYRYADCLLSSQIELSALAHTFGSQPGRRISIQWAHASQISPNPTWSHHWRSGADSIDLSVAHADGGWLLRVPELADFQIDPGCSAIAVIGNEGLDASTLEHLLLDQVLPRVLAQQGELVIHAAAADIGGRLALFLGDSGQGKSTLAAMLHCLSHGMTSDDCVILRTEGGGVTALPTYPSLRLWPDSIKGLFPPGIETTAVAGGHGKRRIPLPGSGLEGQPLMAIYVLGAPASHAAGCSIRPMTPAAACLELTRQSFTLDPSDMGRAGTALAVTARIASGVACFELCYPRSFKRLPAVAEAITAHLPTLDEPGAGSIHP